jgi:DNA-binding response OmpR family regulator
VNNTRMLLVTDDPEAGRIWAYVLGQQRSEIIAARSAEDALKRWEEEGGFDLIVIDVYTSQLNGIALCRRLRAEAIAPILLFTPRTDEAYILQAYRAGADECVVKPISPSLFVAKVNAWLRLSWTIATDTLDGLKAGTLYLDPSRREVKNGSGSAVRLTNLEFRLLYLLMSHRGRILESEVIVNRVWGYTDGDEGALLKNAVYRLRRKIENDPGQPRYIQTVAGIGYVFEPG